MKRILIYVAYRVRDSASMHVLGELLKRRGHSVAYASPMNANFLVRTWKPDLVFLTNPDTVDGYITGGLIGPDHGPAVVIFPQEGMNFAEIDIRRWYDRFKDPAKAALIDKIFFWNRIEYDWVLENTALTRDQLGVAGGMRLDLVRYSNDQRKKNEPARIGFIGRFTHLNRYDGTPLGLKLVTHDDPGDLNLVFQYFESQYMTLACYGEVIRRLMEETDFSVSLRGHHEETTTGPIYQALKRRYGDRMEADHSESIYHWALGMDAIVTPNSSTLSEIYMAKTPAFNVDALTGAAETIQTGHLSESNEPMLLDCYGEDTLPTSYDQLLAGIKNCIANPPELGRNDAAEAFLAKGYSWPFKRSAIGIIATGIDDCLRTGRTADRRQRGVRAPKLAADLYYFRNIRRDPDKSLSGMTDTFFNPLLHRAPPYVKDIADNIEKEMADAGGTLPRDNHPGGSADTAAFRIAG